jgi:hypothetical protein
VLKAVSCRYYLDSIVIVAFDGTKLTNSTQKVCKSSNFLRFLTKKNTKSISGV